VQQVRSHICEDRSFLERNNVRIAIAGASGFVGSALTFRLLEAHHEVVAFSRSMKPSSSSAKVINVDVSDEIETTAALADVDTAYYLVHAMASGDDFREIDRAQATAFGRSAANAGVRRIVYLGALGNDPQSAHLASRHEVGKALGLADVDTVELRAAVVFGSGSVSFEILRYVTERLPFMVCPRWVRTRLQPIALDDLLEYLVQSLDVKPGIYEIGGADVTTYREMIASYARARHLRPRYILDIPFLTAYLSSFWVHMVTPVDRSVSSALVESLGVEVIVTNAEPTKAEFSVTPMGVDEALAIALRHQDEEVSMSLLRREPGLVNGVYTVVLTKPVPPAVNEALRRDVGTIGGSHTWYGVAPIWVLRLMLGRLVGERLRTHKPAEIVNGALVDWWRIEHISSGELVLRSVGWFPGDAWLGYRVSDDELHQVAAFRPRGVHGYVYWKALGPIHRVVFDRMARFRIQRAAKLAASRHFS
jgi:uncharacterized protein YbjT (DUF2867 family)